MALEIERKFLVVGEAWKTAAGSRIAQGYLNLDPRRTVRVRVSDGAAWLTIKGLTVGATRLEFEYPIPIEDAEALLKLCESSVEKTRRRLEHAGRCWEVDEFHGDNAGLVIAEIELESETATVELPSWVGAEVTHDPRYFNSNLAARPYRAWTA